MHSETVNLFFACDERYLALLVTAVTSIKENCDQSRAYEIRVLHTDIPHEKRTQVTDALSSEGFAVTFHDVSSVVEQLSDALHTRDYYSRATYYRLFIPELFPSLAKALYLDSDIIVTGDIAKLFDTPLDGFLAGAIPDGFVNHVPVLRRYVENRVGVTGPYFNAGVLLMNLEEMRRCSFGHVFMSLLSRVTFRVAQDQDYLNVICRDRVLFLDEMWNYMPFRAPEREPLLIHFNLDSKPWQREGVLYAESFWRYAEKTPFYDEIRAFKAAYSEADIARSKKETDDLVALAIAQSDDAEENARIAACIQSILSREEAKA